jgi:gliding motility-associated-like protein
MIVKDFRYALFMLFSLFVYQNVTLAQTDTDFWFVAPEVTSGHGDNPILLRISALSTASQVTITQPANAAFAPIVVTISPNSTSTIDLSPFQNLVENQPADQVLNKGLHIIASAPVTAYYEENSNNNPEIFALKGSNAKGNNFFIPFPTDFDNGSYTPPANSSFEIVATEDNTLITISLTGNIIGHTAGSSFTITLNKGQTYSCVASSTIASQRPIGSQIISTKPICVTEKDDSAINNSCRDLMGDQLVPTNVIGAEYIIMKGFLNNTEKAYILATQNNTDVFVGGSSTPVATLNTGQQFTLDITQPSTYLTASKPVYVLHASGFGCELGSAILPSIECTGSNGVYFTRSTSELFGLNIMIKAGSEGFFTLNGNNSLVPANAFTPVPGSNGNWVAAQISFSEIDIPVGATSTLFNNSPNQTLFHLGIIHGGASSGCRYGYFSDFSSINLGGNKFICINDSLILDAGPLKDSYEWSTGDTIQSISVTQPGEYWVVTIKNGCTSTDTVNVTQENPVVSLGLDTVICGNPPFTLTPGNEFASYLWQDSSNLPFFEAQQNGTFIVEVTTFAGCFASDTIEVEFKPIPPTLSIEGNSPVCEGDTLFISASEGNDIQWIGPNIFNSTEQNLTFNPSVVANSGIYTVTQTVNGCTSSPSNYNAIVSAVPNPEIIGDTIICSNVQVNLFASPGGFSSYNWSNGSNDASIFVSEGKYWVEVTALAGCVGSDTAIVYLVEPTANYTSVPSITALINKSVQFTDSSLISPLSPIASVFWDFGDGSTSNQLNPNHTYADTGTYTVTYAIINEEGCTDTIYKKIKIIDKVIVPNVFSPNGDNVNDLFFIENLEAFKDVNLKIFNRWGRLLYESKDYQNTWDGGNAPDGTYFYVLIIPTGNIKEYKGTVTILK